MKLKIDLPTVRALLKNQYSILGLIIVLAYVLRVLPYLLGYHIPYTEDGIFDFQIARQLSQGLSMGPSETNNFSVHGLFPVLFYVVTIFAKLTHADLLKTFLFLPPLLPSLGLVFLFLFLKKYFPIRIGLLACFSVAVFGPHILWSSQPVIETIGLFFFPLIIFLFDQEVRSNRRPPGANSIWLALACIGMIASHHWSTIMIIGWLACYSWLFVTEKSERRRAFAIVAIFFGLALLYWLERFPAAFSLMRNIFIFSWYLWPLAIILILIFYFIFLQTRRIDWRAIKTSRVSWLVILLPVLVLSAFAIKGLPIAYPIQIWLAFAAYGLLILTGWIISRDDNADKLILSTVCFALAWLVSLPYMISGYKLVNMPFDPYRTFEFAIFPLSILMSFGLLRLKDLSGCLYFPTLIILIVLSTMFYPSALIYKSNFSGTPFYDIRSDIRYISPETAGLIKWADYHKYNVKALTPEVRAYQKTFFPDHKKELILATKSDSEIIKRYGLIHDPIMRINNPYDWTRTVSDLEVIFKNAGGTLFTKAYDAEFVSHNLPTEINLAVGQKITLAFKVKNTGSKDWLPQDDIQFIVPDWDYDHSASFDAMRPTKIIRSGEIADLAITDFKIPEMPARYPMPFAMYWQMFKPGIGFFGQPTPLFHGQISK